MSRTPTVLWAQRNDKVLISIQLEEVKDEQISIDTEKLTFSAKSGNDTYAVDLVFYGNIVPEESKQRKGGREFYFDIKKKETGPYWPRLLKDTKKYQTLRVDFNRWKDEDDSDDDSKGLYDDANLEDMMANMGGGTNGSFDPDDVPDSEDSDDEDIPDLEDEAGEKVESS